MTRIYWIIAIVLLVASIAAPAWLYPGLPDRIPTHWNIKGEVDGYGGKWTLFMFPVMMVPMLVLFYFLPALSPKHFEVDAFRSTYLYIMDLVRRAVRASCRACCCTRSIRPSTGTTRSTSGGGSSPGSSCSSR